MAQGLFSGTNTNPAVARPTEPSTASATTSSITTDVTLTYTPSVYGLAATSYVVTGTAAASTTAAVITQTVTTSPVTITGSSGGSSYVYSVRPQNANGFAGRATDTAAVTPPVVYGLALTANTSTTYTIPAGKTKLAAYVVGGGGSGGTAGGANNGNNGDAGSGGGGGASGGAVTFYDYAVSVGQVFTLNVAATGGISTLVAPGSTTIATANNGGNGANANSNTVAAVGGTGGSGSGNITNIVSITGAAGASGRLSNTDTNGNVAQADAGANASAVMINAVPGFTTLTWGGGGGGGGGGSAVNATPNVGAGGSPSANRGPGGTAGGGAGGLADNGGIRNVNQSSDVGQAATATGAGGGGGGGRGRNGANNQPSGTNRAGGAGFAGTIVLYTA